MKYVYATTRTSARALRTAGKSVSEIAIALSLPIGVVKQMVGTASLTISQAAAAVARKKVAVATLHTKI